jgi:Ca-activated chloride channel family protein
MSKKTPLSSGFVRGAAGAVCLLTIAAGAGLVPVAGLAPAPMTPPAVITPTPPPVVPIGPGCVLPALPTVRDGSATEAGVTLNASLGRGQIVRGSDGQVYLCAEVRVSDAARDVARQPVDLALVLDTSGSMASAMGLLKHATLGIVERMQPADRLTVVSYSNSARVIYQGPPSGAGMAQLEAAVADLIASGGTNISGGIEAGAAALAPKFRCGTIERQHLLVAPSRAKRVLLLTDGLANQGIVEGAGLNRLVTSLRSRGIALSALGLGTSYNEALLGGLADAGGGRYHYVNRPEGLPSVYAAEVDALRSLVARNAILTITPKAGVVVEQVVSWSSALGDGATRVLVGDLEQGRSLKVVARLRLPTGADTNVVDAVDVSLSFQDLERSAPVTLEVAGLSVGLTVDATVAAASVNEAVAPSIQKVEVSEQLSRARTAALEGRREDARRLVLELKEKTGKKALEYEAPSGETMSMDFDEMAEEMVDDAPAAMKRADAAARAKGR